MRKKVILCILLLSCFLTFQSYGGSIKEVIAAYLQIKNALSEDNSSAAAESGHNLYAALKNFDTKGLTSEQEKAFDDLNPDAIENAEHISKNKGNISHQREHFELLSDDMYDLVKIFGSSQTLYKYFCKVNDNGKGAYWLSDTKEIKNPYSGKSGAECGVIKEELK